MYAAMARAAAGAKTALGRHGPRFGVETTNLNTTRCIVAGRRSFGKKLRLRKNDADAVRVSFKARSIGVSALMYLHSPLIRRPEAGSPGSATFTTFHTINTQRKHNVLNKKRTDESRQCTGLRAATAILTRTHLVAPPAPRIAY